MKTYIRIFTFILALFALAGVQNINAQKHKTVITYNDGTTKVINCDSILKIDFEYNPYIQNYYTDTIRLMAGAGYFGYPSLYSGHPITIEEDCDWFDVELTRSPSDSTNFDFNYTYIVYTSPNDSEKDRTGSFKIKSGDHEIEQAVIQYKYTSSFGYYIPANGGSPIKEIDANIEWNDSIYTIGVLPGFGIKLLSYPKWIKDIECINPGEEITTPSKGGSSTIIKFTTDYNWSKEPLTGIILLEDKYGEQLIVNLTKETVEDYANKKIVSPTTQGYLVYGSQVHETDMAYPAYMIAQTVFLGDMFSSSYSGYDWYYSYCTTDYNMGDNSYPSYLSWNTFYKFIDNANNVISSISPYKEEKDYFKAMYGFAHAYRAFCYYMLTVFYEPKANIYTDCSEVLGLTVPIVTENTTEEMAKSNPRATHDEMIAFILNDLEIAEECLKEYTPENKMLPDLSVVYGIRAKVHMWDEDYANAAEYARLAIETSGASPVTEVQWTDPINGFNTANQAWMWNVKYDAENMGNLCNYIGWMNGEAQWGYASLTMPVINRSLYDKISYTDFRKKTFVDPDRENHARESVRGAEFLAAAPDYLALKFRCKGGDHMKYSVGGAVELPMMRVEELYFIEAEAVAHTQGVDAGKALLESFMQTYRDAEYKYDAAMAGDNAESQLRNFQLEVLTQMRIEFWGEGNAFQQAKRIQPGVMQNYTGTNAPDDKAKVNCYGIKPTWNMVIPANAMEKNAALINNPNPTNTVQCPSDVDVYAPGNN